MTINQLRQYRKLKGRMLLLKTERDELILKSKVTDGTGCKSNKTSDVVADTVQERQKISDDIEKLEKKLNYMESYIDNCDEDYSTMLRLHYIKGEQWTAIAMKKGGNNTADGVRMACHRYVKNNP